MSGNTPTYGIPYPEATDLVADYPALGQSLATTVDDKLPTLAATAPSTPSVGQVWIDSSGGNPIGKVWDGAAWTTFSGVGAAAIADTPTGTYTDIDGDWAYWEYTASGTLTVNTAGLADVLIVSGGAGGGRHDYFDWSGGGGGAGGYLGTSVLLNVGTHTVTVGAGGAGRSGSVGPGTDGSNSYVQGFLYTTGGGAGSGSNSANTGPGRPGGSGGGSYGDTGTGGAGIPGQGNDGNSNSNKSGGGGSAGAGASPAGGPGTSNSITGTAVTYAAGGAASASGVNGAANTGNGGGGGVSASGGSGGSGVVIVRVKV